MKLWKKISLLCMAILVLVMTVCLGILLCQTQRKILALTCEQVADRQRQLASSFSRMTTYYRTGDEVEAVETSLVRYCFSQFSDTSSVLMRGGETLYSHLNFSPADYLTPDGTQGQALCSGLVNGRRVLIAGSTEILKFAGGSAYTVYVVEDITPVYADMHRLLLQFSAIAALSILAGLFLILTAVRGSLRPLAQLQATASHIAQGNYAQRAEIHADDEVGMIAAGFNRMVESVEQHIRELTETAERQKLLISAVTHEFKTPLTSILLNADSLQNTCLEDSEREKALERIEGQCKWLERLVQKLLQLICLREALKPQPCDVPALLSRVRESTQETLARHSVTLETVCRVQTLMLDADLMQSALVNLVENAARASAPGQCIRLYACKTHLDVADSGIGIAPEELARLTEPFYTVDRSRSKKQGGLGLGLALAKRIVEAHQGQLLMESTPGIGTRVRIQLKESSFGNLSVTTF